MIVRVTFKTPDVLDNADFELPEGVDEDEYAGLIEEAKEELEMYIGYGEYLRVEFDTEAGSAKVLTT